jgi:uncharacterized repeat protein (TIGR04138 family)
MAQEKKSSLEKITEILAKDNRYRAEAYFFLLAALEYSLEQLGERRHLTGKELLEGIRVFALKQYGLMTKTVFESWGVKTTDDFGEIVFTMVDAGVLSKTETDSKEDFHNLYDFDEVFVKKYPFKTDRTNQNE